MNEHSTTTRPGEVGGVSLAAALGCLLLGVGRPVTVSRPSSSGPATLRSLSRKE